MRPSFLTPLAMALLLFVASACSGSRETSTPDDLPPPDDREETPRYELSEFEDFDPRPYREEALGEMPEVEHDVPASLMDGRADEQTMRTVDGYRIQIFSSQNKREADERVNEVAAWWDASREDGTLRESYPGDASTTPVYLVFRQPYYRVRLGNFAERDEAADFLRLVTNRFPDAFIIPDRVTVMQ